MGAEYIIVLTHQREKLEEEKKFMLEERKTRVKLDKLGDDQEDEKKESRALLTKLEFRREQMMRETIAHLKEDIRQMEKKSLRLRNRRGSMQMILDQMAQKDEAEMVEQKAKLITLNQAQHLEDTSRQEEDRKLEQTIASEKHKLQADRESMKAKKKKNIDAALTKKRAIEEKRRQKEEKLKKNLNRLM